MPPEGPDWEGSLVECKVDGRVGDEPWPEARPIDGRGDPRVGLKITVITKADDPREILTPASYQLASSLSSDSPER